MKSFNNYGPAIRDLQALCAFKLGRVGLAYGYNEGRPAQRYTDAKGRRRYRPWTGPIGGAWPRKSNTAILLPSSAGGGSNG